MRTFIVSYAHQRCTISGENLIEAVENNFESIAKLKPIGNVAGYQLDRVWLEYNNSILGGNGGGVLYILAHGSDCLINYDPTNDPPFETQYWIEGVKAEDLPELHEFELKDSTMPSIGPFDNFSGAPAGHVLGIIKAIIDEIGDYHCYLKPDFPICQNLDVKYPTLAYFSPFKYIEAAQQALVQLQPKTDKTTAKLMSRLIELIAQFTEQIQNDNTDMTAQSLFYYKASHYFNVHDTVTALAYYRLEKGKTQQQVADEVGISVRQLQNYENAISSTLGDAKFSVVEKLANAVGVSPIDLVENGLAICISKRTKVEQKDK